MKLICDSICSLEITDEEGEVKILQNDKINKKLEGEEKHKKDCQVLSKVKKKEEKIKVKLQIKEDKQRKSKKIKSDCKAMDKVSHVGDVKEERIQVGEEKGPVVVMFGRTPEVEVMTEVVEEVMEDVRARREELKVEGGRVVDLRAMADRLRRQLEGPMVEVVRGVEVRSVGVQAEHPLPTTDTRELEAENRALEEQLGMVRDKVVKVGRSRQAEVALKAQRLEARVAEKRQLEEQLAELEGRMGRLGEVALERRGQEEQLARTRDHLVSCRIPLCTSWAQVRVEAGAADCRRETARVEGERCAVQVGAPRPQH